MPARWALLGGVMAAARLGVASYWMNSYWGGAVAAAGGALVLGGLARIFKRARARDGLALGLGIAILANSRPYEGFLFCVPVAGALLWWLVGKGSVKTRRERLRVVMPLITVMALAAAWSGYYDHRLTGNALLLPHVLNARTYQSVGLFLWDKVRAPRHYNNQQFEDFYNGWARENYGNTWSDVGRVSWEKLTRLGSTFFWWGALLLLPGCVCVFRDRKLRLPLGIFVLEAVGVFVVIWSYPHYAAPVTCIIFALLVQSMRHLQTMKIRAWPIGKAMAHAAMVLLLADTTELVARHECDPKLWFCQGDPSRETIARKLAATPGKHLVMVRYGEDHNIHDEWVYNGAEIDGAKVLWARELSAQQNANLFAYFKDRQIWLVEPDEDNTRLAPYEKAEDE
ncbi:MAG: hypothetical protein NVS9B4_09860 [Candidatus Acidiferrum sp.]